MAPGIFHRFKNHFKRQKVSPGAELPTRRPSLDKIDDSRSASVAEPTFFSNAHDFTIQKQTIIVGSSKSLFDLFQGHVVVGAAHNSEERCDAPKCHLDTRIAVQEDILGWIIHGDLDDPAKQIMWVTGPAGTGKTAIAGSVAEVCQERGLLAGSFFFSSFSASSNRHSKRYVVSTLAYQIASSHPGLQAYASVLVAVVEQDPTIFSRRLKDQAQALILEPLRELQGQWDSSTFPKVIIVDGLDEVEADYCHDPSRHDASRTNEDDQAEILSILTFLSLDPAFPFRIVICSRPERIINEILVTNASEQLTTKLFLDFKYNPDSDIELYLKAKFADVRRRYGLSASWPPHSAIKWIVDRASGNFIFAATIMRFVVDASELPQAQLERVLTMHLQGGTGQNPFRSLDSLYMQIIKSSPRPHIAVKWIRAISEPSEAVQLARPAFIWKHLLESSEGEVNYILNNLASLIAITTDSTPHFKIYHKSLLDFLSDQARCGDLYVEKAELHLYIADRFVALLKKGQLSLALKTSGNGSCEASAWQRVTSYISLVLHQLRPWLLAT
ncbi:hypothetical protein FA13DRAFT_1798328 [Coprinellus micaceus]|uniref:Nephrocystin 3-like N-terminal domain-containing protein n=1 Tax=Coprinellus micaceus TaxID=71717 RepID=A0A4Y7SMV6_COPMI|nr:hypothetical protein FA13DRAFT_1798328 [Coprinellus micaceus]